MNSQVPLLLVRVSAGDAGRAHTVHLLVTIFPPLSLAVNGL